eukprot:g2607.t1
MVKFGEILEHQAYGPWREHYVNYKLLKRLIKKLKEQRDHVRRRQFGSAVEFDSLAEVDYEESERRSSKKVKKEGEKELNRNGKEEMLLLIRPGADDGQDGNTFSPYRAFDNNEEVPSVIFMRGVKRELLRVDKYFQGKNAELHLRLNELESALPQTQRERRFSKHVGKASGPSSPMGGSGGRWAPEGGATDYAEVKKFYVELLALSNYCRLNRSGFRKIVKKFDKQMNENELKAFMAENGDLESASFSSPSGLDSVQSLLERCEKLVSRDRLVKLQVEAKSKLRELRAKEFSSSSSFKVEFFGITVSKTLLTLLFCLIVFFIAFHSIKIDVSRQLKITAEKAHMHFENAMKKKTTFVGRNGQVRHIYAAKGQNGFVPYPFWKEHLEDGTVNEKASRCLAVLMLVIMLWVTETLPYYVTALFVPLVVVACGVLYNPASASGHFSHEEAANIVMSKLVNRTTILILGGYCISSVFSRVRVEVRLAHFLQQKLGHKPSLFILAVMYCGCFLSMWISNRTAPVLCVAVVMPIVQNLPTSSKFARGLLLGIAIACNFGGMMTPISSLQNILAVAALESTGTDVSFGEWIIVASIFCTGMVAIAWIFIMIVIRPNDLDQIPPLILTNQQKLSLRDYIALLCSFFTVILWATFAFSPIRLLFGDLSIIAMIFIVAMFGAGVLTETDFNSMHWHTLFFLGGGNVLALALQSNFLIAWLADETIGSLGSLHLSDDWLNLGVLFCCTVIATIVSHSVTAILVMPLLVHIGKHTESGDPKVLVVSSALAISAAMAFPISSFPNIFTCFVLDDFQKPFLTTKHFLQTGLPISLLSVLMLGTVGTMLIKTFMN